MIDATYAAFSTRIGTEVFAPAVSKDGAELGRHPSHRTSLAISRRQKRAEDARKNYPEMLVVAKVMRGKSL